MEIARENPRANVVRAWEPGRVRIGDRWLAGNLIVAADTIIEDWDVATPADVDVETLGPAIALDPEIILLGTGPELSIPDVGLMAALAARRIGLEIMSTPAACRTFNVLLHEHRRVVVALLNPAAR